MAAPRKRKAAESPPAAASASAAPKVSKKQLREEAKAKARIWAEQEKLDKRSKSASTARDTATAIAASASGVEGPEEVGPRSAKRQKMAPVTAAAAVAAPTSQKANLTKQELIQQARLKAQQWSNEQTKGAPTHKEAPTAVSARAVVSARTRTPTSTGSRTKPVRAVTRPVQDHEEKTKPPTLPHSSSASLKLTSKPFRTAPSPLPFVEEETPISMPAVKSQKSQSTQYKPMETKCKQPPHNPIAESVQVAEWNMKQKQDDLEKSIRDQVLANATIVRQPIHQQQPVYQHHQQHYQPPPVVYGPPPPYENQGSSTKIARPYLTMIASVSIAFVALAARTLFMQSSTGGDIAFLTTTATKRTPCFIDTYTLESSAENTNKSTLEGLKCNPTIAKTHCPAGALCLNGVLHSCLDPLESVAISGDGCVLSDATNATLARVEAILTEWTVQHTCGFQGCEFATMSEHAKGPLFSLIDVEADEAFLVKSHKLIVVKDEDGATLVGFSDYYMENELVLPWMCWLSLLFLQLVQAISALTFGLLRFSGGIVWSIGMAYPLVSIVCLVALWVLRYLRLRKFNHQALLRDVAQVRQMTYQKLMADSLEHVVLHLRDEVALDLHPTSKARRTYIISKVWPRVVGDVRLDNRVHKTNQLCLGKPRDVWQWVATPNKRS